MLTRIADIAEPLPRTLAWSAAWEMTREAELKARDFVALVMGGVHAETEVGVAQRLLLQAQTALDAYADPDWACSRTAGRRSPTGCWTWPASAEPGSDHQLAFVNALCTSVLSLRHTAVLATLLDNDPAELGPAGPGRSTPTCAGASSPRWPPAATSTQTASTTPFIDAEAQRDPTAAGKRNAAAASAARPQAAVKDAAWQQVIEDDTIANITTRAIVTGFVQPGQAALLAPFTAKYFDAIAGVWERRSSEVAQTVVIGLYPSSDVSQAGLDAADAFLAGERAARAAPAGDRGPRRRRAGAAGARLRHRANSAPRAARVCWATRRSASGDFARRSRPHTLAPWRPPTVAGRARPAGASGASPASSTTSPPRSGRPSKRRGTAAPTAVRPTARCSATA